MKKKSYEKRKNRYGYWFILPWIVGTIVFFLIPLGKSMIYSLSYVVIGERKMILTFKGMGNYYKALFEDKDYLDALLNTLGLTLLKTPLILIFSLFIAVILNQKFKGRSLARAIFFLPVIIATGPVFSIINGDISNTGNTSAGQFSTMFSSNLVDKLMHFLGIYNFSDKITDYITVISNDIFGIVWNAGIQILIFLAALQNIPASAREAAAIEGATSWEYFWKITFPYVSPFILANFIFTVIDTFSSPVNEVMQRITKIQSDLNFGLAAAMAWIYFIVALSGIVVVTVIMRYYIYYETD